MANLITTVSLLLLRFDAYMPCRMAGAKPPSRRRCSSGRDGGSAAACQRCSAAFGAVDTAFGAWHSVHSLWTSAVEQRTEPCGALRMWTSALRSGPGEVPHYSAMLTDLDSLLLQTSKAQMTPKTLRNCFLGSMSGMRYGHTSTSCILGNVCSCAHCCTAANGRDGRTGLVYLVYQTSTNHTFCVDAILLCQ